MVGTSADKKRMNTLPLSQWLSEERSGSTLIARSGDKDIHLNEFRQDVTRLYARLITGSETCWALCFNDSYQFCVALLATLYAGKIPVLLGHHRRAQLVEQSQHFDGVLSDLPLKLDCPVWSLSDAAPVSVPLPPIAADASLRLFTSGSSGEPRRVDKPVAVMDREAVWLADLWGERLSHCVIRASVSHQHLYGLTFRIWLPLALGRPFASETVAFPEQLANSPRCAFITSPAFLQRLDSQLPPPRCEFVVSAGGPLHFDDAQRAQHWLGVTPDEIYGSTETGVMAWRSRHHPQAAWQPFSGVQLNRDERDNWWVVSPLVPNPLGMALDDRLIVDDRGRFTLAGRRDRVVKIEEKRLSLSDIERRLRTLSGIEDVAVLVVKRGARQCIAAAVVLNQAGLDELEQIGWLRLTRRWRQQLAGWLDPVALPRYWRKLSAIPINQQSKRSWPQLQELFNENR
ncbi:AMP-binding protein [Yersinia nurmii]|uniref:AMP-binding protein n=1 Tax=Yersinia nurmii TaxID=685706 RepID=A0AAW7K234_9GAMM|nr:AMP-binding protein [Yersinia nurmii]MDN0086174.1 AMP-binding protein [Yersinia nurmii]